MRFSSNFTAKILGIDLGTGCANQLQKIFRNYVQITFRSLLKNQVYSFISIGGLAIGLAASIIIFSGLLMRTPMTSLNPDYAMLTVLSALHN
ncbi:MAG: hypothetical protein IM606_13605 [Cytophagales bacterium]|jgi:hypothetical protein|nr:hypothetical protein [Cytophagales bacterium]MCA6389402.1 hypothetical protein [Cytophagales bacterium]MCA6393309.1 hypothetical protein [Cytophagales bacterium]MCA6396215.1 hypothetical protein [Cytophagales bacterium]MCA6397290.1 hypothetical protein [Cytophagales bacterium]